jgi:thioredoxin-related protein
MKSLKYTVFLIFSLLSLNPMAQRQSNGLTWNTDLMKAKDISNATGKPIFAFFTGSDWCGWCRKLQAEVFSKQEFIYWANKNVVLLELDFPRMKKLSPELTQQNQDLMQFFHVTGFPTVWIFFANYDGQTKQFNISPLGNTGYPQNAEPGREQFKFINDANSILMKKKTEQ